MLEPCDGKQSRTVLRGEGSRKAPDLPGALDLPTKNDHFVGKIIFLRENLLYVASKQKLVS